MKNKKIVFTFGRFNPPTVGHLLLATRVKQEASRRGADHIIYGSNSQDRKKNPLSARDKLRFMKKILKGFNIVISNTVITPFAVLDQLQKDGLADNTVIIFFADNGRLEARGIHWCFDSGLHVPMVVHWPKNIPAPDHYRAGSLNNQVISLMDLTATTLSIAGIERPDGMQSRVFLGNQPDPPRQYAFSARDRIDETIVRQRSVRGPRYHYVRNFTPGAGFLTLNRYKEKCFLVKPLMRELHTTGQLTGAAKDLMQPFPTEQLYDTLRDPFEIHNLADSRRSKPQRVLESMRTALDTWMVQTGDLGHIPEPDEIVRPFTKEMHDWFGTPDWYTPDKQ